MTRPILIAGPTASGKSALAIALAERLGGTVINADSQQIFAGWRILSARPAPAEEARAPHALYGHVPMTEAYSVGAWLRDLAPVLAACRAEGRVPVIVGGTGALLQGADRGARGDPADPGGGARGRRGAAGASRPRRVRGRARRARPL